MKYIILILLLNLSLKGQSLLLFEDDGIDPLKYDVANTKLIYNGTGLTNTTWEDQLNSNDLTWVGEPDVTNTLNGHTTVLLNGTDEDGSTGAITLNQPVTYYVLLKQVSWTLNDYIIGATSGANNSVVQQLGTTPQVEAYGGSVGYSNPISPTLGQWVVITIVFNGANSELRLNKDTPITGSWGTANPTGIILGDRSTGSRNANIEYAYFIARTKVDNTITQNKFIDALLKYGGL